MPRLVLGAILILAARVLAGRYSAISDCDEVFNYWEPTHFLQHGYGFQTWEYSPVYAIRSWFYVGMHTLLAKVLDLFSGDKVATFYAVRIAFGLVSALTESQLHSVVRETFGHETAFIFLMGLVFSTGMFISSTAYLPSTFAMYTTTLALSYVLKQSSRGNARATRTVAIVFWTAVGALVGWPFSASAIAATFVLEVVLFQGEGLRRPRLLAARIGRVGSVGLGVLVAILGPMIFVDYKFYRKLVVVPWNIVAYNVFASDKGPNIYGTEPWWFYFANGLLNFNLLFILSLAMPVILLVSFALKTFPSRTNASWAGNALTMLQLSGLYVHLAIFTAQPHKEERFLFVVYPWICLNAAVALHACRGILESLLSAFNFPARIKTATGKLLITTVITLFFLLSLCRTLALVNYYSAPINVYKHLYYNTPSISHPNETNSVCVGKEWYRFPSHYFIPRNHRVRFLRSDFRGLLPKYFFEGEGWAGTYVVPEGMNEENREEMDRYVEEGECNYLVDYDDAGEDNGGVERRYVRDGERWEVVVCEKFLDAARTRRLSRAFWVPWEDRKLVWGQYCLLKKRTT
ncbi:Alg9-like mannosyltransferase family-domain-containing protein [Cladochytrium replicatum]|nr:Alg9-like mannosyltransferase family-domain-containing protein [Cladochytrium replicatum]